jgi:hypothetical protein
MLASTELLLAAGGSWQRPHEDSSTNPSTNAAAQKPDTAAAPAARCQVVLTLQIEEQLSAAMAVLAALRCQAAA